MAEDVEVKLDDDRHGKLSKVPFVAPTPEGLDELAREYGRLAYERWKMTESERKAADEVLYQFAFVFKGRTCSFYTGQGGPGRFRGYIKLVVVRGNKQELMFNCEEPGKIHLWAALRQMGATIMYRVVRLLKSKAAETSILNSLNFIGNKMENGPYRFATFLKALGSTYAGLNPEVVRNIGVPEEDQED